MWLTESKDIDLDFMILDFAGCLGFMAYQPL